MGQTLKVPCQTCRGRGKLWLSGADYLECPHCETLGYILMEEHRVNAKVRTVFMAGQRPHLEVTLPRSLVADIVIPKVV